MKLVSAAFVSSFFFSNVVILSFNGGAFHVNSLSFEPPTGFTKLLKTSTTSTIAAFSDNSNNNNNGISIDVARLPQDLKEIRHCRATAFADKPRLLQSERDFINASQVTTDPHVTCLVARSEESRRILGTADCRIGSKRRSNVLVNNVYVLPDQRGKGIGKLLMTAGVDQFVMATTTTEQRQQGMKITLTVQTQNKPALSLYQQLGYVPNGPANALVLGIAQATGADLLVEMYKNL